MCAGISGCRRCIGMRDNIGAQIMTGDTRDSLHIRKPLGRNSRPHRGSRAADTELLCYFGDHAPARSNEVHTVHARILSPTEQFVKGYIISTADSCAPYGPCMDLATVIRNARKKAGLSQRALADKLGVAPSAVAQWETEVTKPSIDNRVDLASILSIPFSELIPEAVDVASISSKNPQTIILVRKFEELPERVRESILMQVVATAEALAKGQSKPTPGPAPRAKK